MRFKLQMAFETQASVLREAYRIAPASMKTIEMHQNEGILW